MSSLEQSSVLFNDGDSAACQEFLENDESDNMKSREMIDVLIDDEWIETESSSLTDIPNQTEINILNQKKYAYIHGVNENCGGFRPTLPIQQSALVGVKEMDSYAVDIYVRDVSNPCEEGFICNQTHMAKCDDIRRVAVEEFGLGDIHAGIYCPFGYSAMMNCPPGRYCENASTAPKICPAGMFCPMKTEFPSIPCKACPEGALSLKLSFLANWTVLLAVIVLVFLASIIFFGESVEKCKKARKRKKFNRKTEKTDKQQSLKQNVCLQNNLMLVYERLQKLEIDKSSLEKAIRVSEDGEITYFDGSAFFDLLDEHKNGVLSFKELNAVLRLSNTELKDFVRRMQVGRNVCNKREKTDVVSKCSFVEHFLPVLGDISVLKVTKEEAGRLWDELAELSNVTDPKKEVDIYNLYDSSVADCLDDIQINNIILRFQQLKRKKVEVEKNMEDGDEEGDRTRGRVKKGSFLKTSVDAINILNNDIRRGSMLVNAINNVNNVSNDIRRGSMLVSAKMPTVRLSRDIFCLHYPEFLHSVLLSTAAAAIESHSNISLSLMIPFSLQKGIDIAFQNLSLLARSGKGTITVVNDLTGRIRKGTMTAVMGGSGAGKTSFMNAICGRAFYGEVQGKEQVNGHEIFIDHFASNLGFVPQDDIVYAELTVFENLLYAGRFRLPHDTPIEQIHELAQSVLADLGLSRKANTLVGDVRRRGVSGGEKKRVNIGLELMARPSALFLDEPTSGLDSSSALLVMTSLQQLVENKGVTVCAVIHQPRKFIVDLFDSLVLLGVGGRMVYHGAFDQAEAYFNSLGYRLPAGEALADWLIDISTERISPDPGRVWFKKKKETSIYGENEKNLFDLWNLYYDNLNETELENYKPLPPYDLPKGVVTPSIFRQFYIQLQRFLLLAWRNRFTKMMETFVVIAIVCLMAYLSDTWELAGDREKYQVIQVPFEAFVLSEVNVFEAYLTPYFLFATSAKAAAATNIMFTAIIICIVISTIAAKSVVEKKLEFFREAGSGYSITAFFLAVNTYTTLEQGVQVFLAAIFYHYLRHAIVSQGIYFVSFLCLAWIVVSWTLLVTIIIGPSNVNLVLGLFMAMTGLLLGGASTFGISYANIYSNRFYGFLSAMFGPTRFFIESLMVSNFRCLPQQTAYTQEPDAINFPPDNLSYTVGLPLAQLDLSNALKQSCNGWYWGALPAFVVGLTIRWLALGAIHCSNRSKMCKKTIWHSLRYEATVVTYVYIFSYFLILGVLVFLVFWLSVFEYT